MESMLQQMGEAAYAVFPEGTTLEFVKADNGDAYNVFDKQIERCNAEISKAINGGTMVSDNGSSRSQAEIHFKVADYIAEADQIGFSFWVNEYLLPKLARLGYPFLESDRFEFDLTESLGKKDQWEVTKGVLEYYDVAPDWIEKTFGIPVQARQTNQPSPGQRGNEGPSNLFSHGLSTAAAQAHTCCGTEMAISPALKREAEKWEAEYQALYQAIFNGKSPELPAQSHLLYASLLNKAFKKGFQPRLTDIAYDSPDHLKTALFQANIYRFSAAANWETAVELNKVARSAKGFTEFEHEANKLLDQRSRYLYTEYATAEASAQNAAAWLRQVEEKDLFDLQYFTAGDNWVRPDHAAIDGFQAPADDPVWDTIYPPNDYACRCEVIQVPATGIRSSKAIPPDAVKPLFRGNPGKTNIIYDRAHSYFKEFPEVNTLNARKYGLPKLHQVSRDGLPQMPAGVAENDFYKWYEEQKRAIGQAGSTDMHLADFMGRNVAFQLERIKFKMSGPKREAYLAEDRISIAKEVPRMLAEPDEVWISRNTVSRNRQRLRATYLKNYNDGLYATLAETEEDQPVSVITWYKVNAYGNMTIDQVVGNLRNGILMKKADSYE